MKEFLAIWRISLVGAVVIASMGWAAAWTATGTVNGSVTRQGQPVAGVRVVIDSESDSSYGATVDTDPQGAFTFPDAPVGKVHIKVYDSQERLLASGSGLLQQPGEVITVALTVP